MRRWALVFFGLVNFAGTGNSADLGFRLVNGQCVNQEGVAGLNPDFIGECGDLSGKDLSKENFAELNLRGAVFKGAKLEGTVFTQADLRFADLSRSQANEADFSGANLNSANLSFGEFFAAEFSEALMAKALMRNSNFGECFFNRAKLDDANFLLADVSFADFSEAKLNRADFSSSIGLDAILMEAQGVDAKFIGAHFENADFSEAVFALADFTQGILQDALFTGAVVEGARFSRADLRAANLNKLSAKMAHFNRALLEGANLSEGDFRNVSFIASTMTGSNLDDSLLDEARFSRSTKLPITKEEAENRGMHLYRAEVLIVPDNHIEKTKLFAKALEKQDFEVVIADKHFTKFEGGGLTEDHSVVILLFDDIASGLPLAGQNAIKKFVEGGGLLLAHELNFFRVLFQRVDKIKEYFLGQGIAQMESGKITPKVNNHPLFVGFDGDIEFKDCKVFYPSQQFGGEMLAAAGENAAILTKAFQKGRVINMHHSGNMANNNNSDCLNDESIRRLYINAIHWWAER